MPYGATYIEKHITLDRTKKSEDFESALSPTDFKEFVDNIRASEIAIGSSSFKELSEATIRYRNVVRKRIVAKVDILKGEVISMKHLMYKRCDTGLTPENTRYLIGRIANKNVAKDEIVDFLSVQ